MTKEELKKLEVVNITDEIPLLDELYVSVSNKVHESGYKMYKIYGVAYGKNVCEIAYAKCLSEWSDVINIIPTFVNKVFNYNYHVVSIDSQEDNLFRIFVRHKYKIKITHNLSTFEFEVVKEQDDDDNNRK